MPKSFDYVVTYSGKEVSQQRGVPSIEDLALSLSRQPRFGGMCRRHWTVVDHSLFTALLAMRDSQPVAVQMACLLHDAHEWTGDIPTHFKHPGQRQLQREQDWRIFGEFFPQANDDLDLFAKVKEYDSRALLAEALIVGPPPFQYSADVLEHFGKRPLMRDVIALKLAIANAELGVNPSEQVYREQARNAQMFIHKLRALQVQLTEDTTAVRHNEPQGFVANEIRETT